MQIFQASFGHNDWYDYTITVDLDAQEGYVRLDYYNSYVPDVYDFQYAADQTAKLIADTYPRLFLGLSGGIDSVFVGEVLVRNKIDFTPIIIKHTRDTLANSIDGWCRSKNLNPIVIDAVENEKKILKYLSKIAQYGSFGWGPGPHWGPIYAAMLTEIAQQYQGHVIRGAGDMVVHTPEEINAMFSYIPGEVPWLHNYKRCLDFFVYTPEIVMAQATSVDFSLPLDEKKSKLYGLPAIPKDLNFYPLTDYRNVWKKFCILNNRPKITWNTQYRTREQVVHELSRKNTRQRNS